MNFYFSSTNEQTETGFDGSGISRQTRNNDADFVSWSTSKLFYISKFSGLTTVSYIKYMVARKGQNTEQVKNLTTVLTKEQKYSNNSVGEYENRCVWNRLVLWNLKCVEW